MDAARDIKIVVMNDGPYMVYGSVPFAQQFIVPDAMGESWVYRHGEEFALGSDSVEKPTMLCRCGGSASKPYCDGAHVNELWDSTLTSDTENILDDVACFGSEELVLSDNEKYCCYARFCHPGGSAWRLAERAMDPQAKELAIREASMCPSARLMAWEMGSDAPYEFDFEPSIALLEDPAIGCSGGLWLRGGIAVERNMRCATALFCAVVALRATSHIAMEDTPQRGGTMVCSLSKRQRLRLLRRSNHFFNNWLFIHHLH